MTIKEAVSSIKPTEYRVRIPKLLKHLHGITSKGESSYVEMNWFSDPKMATETIKNFMVYEGGIDFCTFSEKYKGVIIRKDFWSEEDYNNAKRK